MFLILKSRDLKFAKIRLHKIEAKNKNQTWKKSWVDFEYPQKDITNFIFFSFSFYMNHNLRHSWFTPWNGKNIIHRHVSFICYFDQIKINMHGWKFFFFSLVWRRKQKTVILLELPKLFGLWDDIVFKTDACRQICSWSCNSGRRRGLRGALEHEPWRCPAMTKTTNKIQSRERKWKKTYNSYRTQTPPTGEAWETSLILPVSSDTADVEETWSFLSASSASRQCWGDELHGCKTNSKRLILLQKNSALTMSQIPTFKFHFP